MTITNILPPDKIYEMCHDLHAKIAIKMEGDDPDAYVMRANEITSIMATTGKMLADAKYHRDTAIRNSVLFQLKDAKRNTLPASVMNELIKAECKDINYIVNWTEQLDKECKYQAEMLRSLISLRKTEMANQFVNQ